MSLECYTVYSCSALFGCISNFDMRDRMREFGSPRGPWSVDRAGTRKTRSVLFPIVSTCHLSDHILASSASR